MFKYLISLSNIFIGVRKIRFYRGITIVYLYMHSMILA